MLKKKGDLAGAKEYLSRALSLDPDYLEAKDLLLDLQQPPMLCKCGLFLELSALIRVYLWPACLGGNFPHATLVVSAERFS